MTQWFVRWVGGATIALVLSASGSALAAPPQKPAASAAASTGKPGAAKPTSSAKPTGSSNPGSATGDLADDDDAPVTLTPADIAKATEGMDAREKKIFTVLATIKWQPGPTKVKLSCGATVDLPAQYKYLDVAQSKRLLDAYGHSHNDSSQGIIGPKDPDADWQVYLDYEDSGYIKDDEKVDADDLLKALREGQEEANTERVKQGHPALRINGWSEPPRYDRAQHQLVWGLKVREDKDTSDAVNYNTRVLGRKGYISVNLVASVENIEKYKSDASTLLNATTFDAGSRYADFSSKTDKVAEYGLAGLILGGAGLGAAKLAGKVGIIALIAKGGKGLAVFLLAPFAALKRWMNKNKNPQA